MNNYNDALLAAFFFPSAALALIFGMKYFAAIMQAKTLRKQDESYREMAAQAAASQSATNAALSTLTEMVADVQARLIAVEHILKTVE